jgi:hypothetical protein
MRRVRRPTEAGNVMKKWWMTPALVLALLLGASGAEGQAAVPYGPGELATYQVRLGALNVGQGAMQVMGLEMVDGRQTYRTRFTLAGGIPFARVDNRFESWIDVNGLFSRRFFQDQKEVRFTRRRTFEFFPERRAYRVVGSNETGTLPTNRPLDEVSFLYYVRTLPLRVGESYTFDQYYREDGNPVVLHVLRRETVRVPAGTFNTIVVRPVIKTRGLFGEGGDAEVYFTDDSRRILVQMRSRVPVVGSLTLHLSEYRAGQPLRAGSEAAGAARPAF